MIWMWVYMAIRAVKLRPAVEKHDEAQEENERRARSFRSSIEWSFPTFSETRDFFANFANLAV